MANRITFDEIPSFLEENYVVTSVVQQVIKNLQKNYNEFQKVTDQDLLDLSSIFGETFEKALEIVEANKVTYYQTNSEIGVYQVEGSSDLTYTIFPSVNYCQCHWFRYQVARGPHLICKHVLATVIAHSISKQYLVKVTNEHLNDLLLASVFLI